MNAPAAGNALNSSSFPMMKKRSIVRNAAKARFASWSAVPDFWEIHRHLNADPVRHQVFPEPADVVAAVRCKKYIRIHWRLIYGESNH
jgi:hypothetical protein